MFFYGFVKLLVLISRGKNFDREDKTGREVVKYLIVAVLFILSLGYAGYYLYMLDKTDDQQAEPDPTAIDSVPDIVSLDAIPDYLTQEFWQSVTPKQLTETLKRVKNINLIRPDSQETMLTLWAQHGQHPKMANMLIQAGADVQLRSCKPNAVDKRISCATALHYASARANKSYEFVQVLLPHYKNMDEQDSLFGSTPLHWATFFRSSTNTIHLLLEKGANPNLQDKSRKPCSYSGCYAQSYVKRVFY